MRDILKAVSDSLEGIGITYAYGWYKDHPGYPYWVGDYTETEGSTEDGLRTASMTLTGTAEKLIDLETDRAAIERLYNPIEGITMPFDKGMVKIWYASSLSVPVDVEGICKLQINLTIKEWRVF